MVHVNQTHAQCNQITTLHFHTYLMFYAIIIVFISMQSFVSIIFKCHTDSQKVSLHTYT